MHLYKIRLLCGTDGLYETEMEISHAPEYPSQAVKVLLDAFNGDGLIEPSFGCTTVTHTERYDDRNACIVNTTLSGVPSTAVIMRATNNKEVR